MASIMNENWDAPMVREIIDSKLETVDEGAAGTVAKAGLVAGVGAGVYEGVKRHKIAERRSEEKRDKVDQLVNAWNAKRDKKRQRREENAEKRHNLVTHKMERWTRDADRDLRESTDTADATDESAGTVAKAAGLGLVGYGAYTFGKELTADAVKGALDKKKELEREHEYAFREKPKETVKKLKDAKKRARNEAADVITEDTTKGPRTDNLSESTGMVNILSKVW